VRRRRIKILLETKEVVAVRLAPRGVETWCSDCRKRVELAPPDLAADAAGTSTRTIYRWIESGKVHFAESPKGRVLVCLNSVLRGKRE